MHGVKAAFPCFRASPCLPYQHAGPRVRCRSAPELLRQETLSQSRHPARVQPTPEGGIEVLLTWPLPAHQHQTQHHSPISSSTVGGGEEQGEKMAIVFSAMGSGLLWARSTGLKVRLPVPVCRGCAYRWHTGMHAHLCWNVFYPMVYPLI